MGEEKEEEPKEGTPDELLEKEEDEWFESDHSMNTHPSLRHAGRIKNLKLSRQKASEFLEMLIKQRLAKKYCESLKPFQEFMLDHLAEKMNEEDKKQFALSTLSAVKRFSAEPDFLAY